MKKIISIILIMLFALSVIAEVPRQSINFNDAISGKYMANKICHIEKDSAQFVNENTIFEQIKYWETDKYGNETYELIDEETGAVVMVHFEDIVVLEGDLPEVTKANYYLADPIVEEDDSEWKEYDAVSVVNKMDENTWCPNCWGSRVVKYFEGYEGNSYAYKFICPKCDELYVKREYHTHDWKYTSRVDYVDNCTVLRHKYCTICFAEELEEYSAEYVSGPTYQSGSLTNCHVYYVMRFNSVNVSAHTYAPHDWQYNEEAGRNICSHCGGWQ